MVYTANWGIICYLPPFTRTCKNQLSRSRYVAKTSLDSGFDGFRLYCSWLVNLPFSTTYPLQEIRVYTPWNQHRTCQEAIPKGNQSSNQSFSGANMLVSGRVIRPYKGKPMVTQPKTNMHTQNDGTWKKVTPFKHGNFWYQFVSFLECVYIYIRYPIKVFLAFLSKETNG